MRYQAGTIRGYGANKKLTLDGVALTGIADNGGPNAAVVVWRQTHGTLFA